MQKSLQLHNACLREIYRNDISREFGWKTKSCVVFFLSYLGWLDMFHNTINRGWLLKGHFVFFSFRLKRVPIHMARIKFSCSSKIFWSFSMFSFIVVLFSSVHVNVSQFSSLVGLFRRIYVPVNGILHASNMSEKLKLLEFRRDV